MTIVAMAIERSAHPGAAAMEAEFDEQAVKRPIELCAQCRLPGTKQNQVNKGIND
jgi:hypothetical protein